MRTEENICMFLLQGNPITKQVGMCLHLHLLNVGLDMWDTVKIHKYWHSGREEDQQERTGLASSSAELTHLKTTCLTDH